MQNGKKREEIPERVFLRLKNRSLIIVQLSLQKSPVLALKASSEASIITSNAIYFIVVCVGSYTLRGFSLEMI